MPYIDQFGGEHTWDEISGKNKTPVLPEDLQLDRNVMSNGNTMTDLPAPVENYQIVRSTTKITEANLENAIDLAHIQYQDITYANLVIAIAASTLVKGTYYRITDYATKHLIPDTSTINTGTTEPLIVLATGVNTISGAAYSVNYPNDLITYDITNNLCEDSSTPRNGLIVWRKYLIDEVEAFYDWRIWKFRRYQLLASSYGWSAGATYVVGDMVIVSNILYYCYKTVTVAGTSPGSDSAHWVKVASALNINSCRWVYGATIGVSALILDTATYIDFLTFNGVSYKDIQFCSGCTDNVFLDSLSINEDIQMCGSSSHNTFGFSCSGIYFRDGCSYNNFDNNCSYITFGVSCTNITFGRSCSYHTFGNNATGSIVGLGSYSITMADDCLSNVFANTNSYIKFGDYCQNNVVSANCYSIDFNAGCTYNELGNGCHSIRLNDDSYSNKFKTGSQNILGIGELSNFDASSLVVWGLIIESGVYDFTGVDLSTSTLLPALYTKYLQIDSAGAIRLKYMSSTGAWKVTNIAETPVITTLIDNIPDKSPAVDADKIMFRNSVSSWALFTDTCANFYTYLKGKFDLTYEVIGTMAAHLLAYDHTKIHTRSHAVDSTSDHSIGSGTSGKLVQFDTTAILKNAELTGDVSTSGLTTTIGANKVTLAMLATQAANTVLANQTAGVAVPTAVAMAASTILARLASGNIVAASTAEMKTLLAYLQANDALGTPASGTLSNCSGYPAVSTSIPGLCPILTAPASTFMNYVGITYGETAATMKALFDATVPSTQAYSDAAAAGSATVAARRDHKHAMPAIYAHPNHSGNVTSVGDGATTIANSAVTLAMMANLSAQNSFIGRKTAGAGVPEECSQANAKTMLGAGAASGLATLDASTKLTLAQALLGGTYTATGAASPFAITAAMDIVVGNKGSAQIITLPDASTVSGKIYIITNANASGVITINPYAGDTIAGLSTISLPTQYDTVLLISDGGTNWLIGIYTASVMTAAPRMPLTGATGVLAKEFLPTHTGDVTGQTALSITDDLKIKGWVYFTISGTTATVQDSLNCVAVTRTSVGIWTIAWTTDFASANYACVTAVDGLSRVQTTNTSGAITTITCRATNGDLTDPTAGSAIAIGVQV